MVVILACNKKLLWVSVDVCHITSQILNLLYLTVHAVLVETLNDCTEQLLVSRQQKHELKSISKVFKGDGYSHKLRHLRAVNQNFSDYHHRGERLRKSHERRSRFNIFSNSRIKLSWVAIRRVWSNDSFSSKVQFSLFKRHKPACPFLFYCASATCHLTS